MPRSRTNNKCSIKAFSPFDLDRREGEQRQFVLQGGCSRNPFRYAEKLKQYAGEVWLQVSFQATPAASLVQMKCLIHVHSMFTLQPLQVMCKLQHSGSLCLSETDAVFDITNEGGPELSNNYCHMSRGILFSFLRGQPRICDLICEIYSCSLFRFSLIKKYKNSKNPTLKRIITCKNG